MLANARMLLNHARSVLQQQGVSALARLIIKRLKRKAGHYSPGYYDFGYDSWLKTVKSKPQLPELAIKPVISILVPVYNVKEAWLSEMIESVLGQAYPHWELCLVNDCATDHHVAGVLKRYAEADARIKLHLNTSNIGIAATSNQALSLSTGAFIALLDHDDLLAGHALARMAQAIEQNPGADLFYSDEDKIDSTGRRVSPFFKPGFSPALLRSQNYFGHLAMLSKSLIDQVGGFNSGLDGAQDYDLVLRASEQAAGIVHIPEVLYHWRQIPGSTAAIFGEKDYAWKAGERALQSHLDRCGDNAVAEKGSVPGTYRVRYAINNQPVVSIIIPFRDQPLLLEQCLRSLLGNTQWPNIEILGIDNQSTETETRELMQRWTKADSRIRFIHFDQPFNFSAICNAGVAQAQGEYIVLMNNDIEVLSPDWIENLLQYAQQSTTGAVGAQLVYPDNSIQHAGIVTGIGGSAGHPFKHFPETEVGYYGRLKITSNVSAVTAALLVVNKQKYLEVGGFDEAAFSVALNDVDFCLKLLDAGYQNIVTPDVRAIHHESKTRGIDTAGEKATRYAKEVATFQSKWNARLDAGDPYYNPNLTMDSEDYRLRGV